MCFPAVGKGSSREGGFEPSNIEGQLMGKDKTESNTEECVWSRRRNILDTGWRRSGCCGCRMVVGVEDRR